MSWAQVECVKCGQPMGDHAGLFVEGKPWHTACHYSVLTARLASAEEAARILFDELSLFTRTEWLLERWPWLADEAKGEP